MNHLLVYHIATIERHPMIHQLSWYHDITAESRAKQTIHNPSLTDILCRFTMLDSQKYPSLTLRLTSKRCPFLSIYGGPSGYAIWLSLGDQNGNCGSGLITYVNPETQNLPATNYRTIGLTYPGCEIEERFFTADIALIRSLIEHFVDTGYWKTGVPFVFERDDDDGIPREYTQILGEPVEYPELY